MNKQPINTPNTMQTAQQYDQQIAAAAIANCLRKKHFYEVLDENYKYLGAPTDYATIPQAKKYARMLCRELGRQSVQLSINDFADGTLLETIEITMNK